ncbi:MAG: COR domain-containing protein, partial [Cyanobacteria bacterium J06607_13]
NTNSPEKVFNYLHELLDGKKRQLSEAKLLLIGQGSVGKTSIISHLVSGTFNPNECQTDGLKVSEWTIEVNTKPVRLNVWDFGGQEIYHATHQFFLTKRSLYILTCNCRTSEEENRIEYWLKLIQSFGGNSPVIIVGNKYDEQPLDINRKALREKYPNIKAILETSCKTGHGIETLREKITYEVSQLSDVYNLLPLTWFNVKEQLETLKADFITYARYACLCHEQNVTEEQSQEQLIDLLHNLGLVLNFREHPILKDTNVLKPDWVTTGIYALLSDDTLKTKTRGILTKKDLTRILDPARYPTTRHSYLIDLMEEFQLGFLLTGTNPKKFLIPGLLPKDEPENTDLEGDTLEFQYHYRILPESIISRFIVLMHEDIHESVYWRSGVMLRYIEAGNIYNIARIKADPEDKKIFIAISGKPTTRRTFLGIIRKTFHRIHSSFPNPDITEWVPVPDHSNHPPLDYQELLGLERMGEQTYPIGKLGIRVNIRQLLDGYEPLETRLQRRQDEMGEEGRFAEKLMGRDIHLHFNQSQKVTQAQGDHQPMSTTVNQYGQGDNIAGDKVLGDKINTQINNNPDLAQAARDIKALLTELSDEYNPNSEKGQTKIKEGTLARIRENPQLKQRTLKALKSAGEEALEQAIQHPIAKIVVESLKSFIEN